MNSTNSGPLVSIIINCFNSSKYLKETVESVLEQTYRDFELIFWDNQSTDESAEIVKSFEDPRIRYFYAPRHTSLGEGRNLALKKATGEYISFLDADDTYNVDRIETCLGLFSDDSVGLVYSNGEVRRNDTTAFFYKKPQKAGDLFDYWLKRYNVMIPSVMFRRSCLSTLDGDWVDVRFSMVEEYDFFLRIAKAWKVAYCHESLCTWREHSQSMTWSKLKEWSVEFELLANKLTVQHDVTLSGVEELRKKSSYYMYLFSMKMGKLDRKILSKFTFSDIRFFFLYLLSFLGLRVNLIIYTRLNLLKS